MDNSSVLVLSSPELLGSVEAFTPSSVLLFAGLVVGVALLAGLLVMLVGGRG